MLKLALENEVDEFIQKHSALVDCDGRKIISRNGYMPERDILTGIGPLTIKQPRVDDRQLDKNKLIKEIDDIKNNTGKTTEKISADSGYRSSDNIEALKDSKVYGYIATGKGEKHISEDKKIGKKNFSYDSKEDIFICPAGHKLEL